MTENKNRLPFKISCYCLGNGFEVIQIQFRQKGSFKVTSECLWEERVVYVP